MQERPTGFATYAEMISAIRDFERARRRAVSKAQWPPQVTTRQAFLKMLQAHPTTWKEATKSGQTTAMGGPVYGMLVRR
jgi:hypothetical protein